ncbi:MarR family winged helix-turn-helix transcriptional regulator [Dyadobacter frigoris]|uniref:MarR family transcriptional regulator n=1 Tax=Dyadobacter frigoris TaxID=2576211 RepID=A0A4V6BI17_9BACT|nr:MarR family transcriptional regulator [Dyadobacter frigoris]TKT87553.1 MarR family transcriptional regulator [Dyadobacter frigoris]GLU52187.1 multiple antibiotic resistance protein MarR [Dyadobacter frigoris]
MPKRIEFHFKKPEDSPGYLLGQLTMLWQRKQKRVLDPLDLTHTQFALLCALAWLSRENDKVTQVDIANQGNADRMMVSKVLRTLEEKNFITRNEHPTDTRAKTIKLTPDGEMILQKAIICVETADLDFFHKFGTDLTTFNSTMAALIEQNNKEV